MVKSARTRSGKDNALIEVGQVVTIALDLTSDYAEKLEPNKGALLVSSTHPMGFGHLATPTNGCNKRRQSKSPPDEVYPENGRAAKPPKKKNNNGVLPKAPILSAPEAAQGIRGASSAFDSSPPTASALEHKDVSFYLAPKDVLPDSAASTASGARGSVDQAVTEKKEKRKQRPSFSSRRTTAKLPSRWTKGPIEGKRLLLNASSLTPTATIPAPFFRRVCPLTSWSF
jgi:hypothetical protein